MRHFCFLEIAEGPKILIVFPHFFRSMLSGCQKTIFILKYSTIFVVCQAEQLLPSLKLKQL